jgi:phytoene dehydrogenase-like protein
MADEKRFDVVLIGSGMGALATASILAQLEHKRVLVLEQHFKAGGFTHTFRRNGYEWDVGLHYVGKMATGGVFRAMMDYVTAGSVDWNPMPDVYDRFVFPDFSFDFRAGRSNLKADLISRFPREEKAIAKYLRDVDKSDGWIGRYIFTQGLPRFARPLARLIRRGGTRLALTTTREYLKHLTANARLEAVLGAQWGLYGLPPSVAPFASHAMLVKHYMDGGWYPVGGSGALAAAVVRIIRQHGGDVWLNHRVDEIIVQDGVAKGVNITQRRGKVEIARTAHASTIVSDAGAHATYMKLLPQNLDLVFRDELGRFPAGCATITVYLGLKSDPAELGVKGENYWIFTSDDHEEIYAQRNALITGQASGVYVSFPSAKNPHATHHTAELIAFVDATRFAQWASLPWRARGADYERLKDDIAATLIALVDRHIAGFADHISYREVSTPLSTEHFTGHRNGTVYGLPPVAEKFRAEWLGPRTPIRNLYLTGADAVLFGVVGAMFSGAITASVIMGRPWSLMRIFSRAIRFSKAHHRKNVVVGGGAGN